MSPSDHRVIFDDVFVNFLSPIRQLHGRYTNIGQNFTCFFLYFVFIQLFIEIYSLSLVWIVIIVELVNCIRYVVSLVLISFE
jgi:hypothetical protein